jgi:WD40 repeat protein
MDRSAGGQEDSPRGLFSVQDLQEGRARLGRTSSLRSVSSRDDANDEVVAQNSSEHDAGRTSFARTIPLDVVQPKGTGKDLHVARGCALSADGSHAAFNCVDPGGFPFLAIFEIATKAPPVCLIVDREATWRTRDDSEQETPEETAGQTPPANRSRQKTIDRELDVESIWEELMETLKPPPAARGCSLSSSGRVAIAYGESGWIVVWRDVHHSHLNREGHPKAEVIPASVSFKEEAHSRTINYCHFTGDEKRFISCADDMTVRIWNVEGEAVQ